MPETHFCRTCGTLLEELQKMEGSCPRCLMQLALDGSPHDSARSSGLDAGIRASELEAVADALPQYEILTEIGRGGMGRVYKARQRSLQRIVALKVLPPALGRDSNFSDRFQREAQALAELSHPGIVHIYDYGQAGDFYYFAMEFVDGSNLREVIRRGDVSPATAFGIVAQVSAALQYAHDRGVVHRDVKPENILVDRHGSVRLTDFGLAKWTRPHEAPNLTRSNQVMGTVHYMAPEQFERPREVDHRADVYSLGVVFYELLTGELPLGRFTLPSRKADLDRRVDAVVLKSLQKEPAERYERVEQLAEELGAVSADAPRRGRAMRLRHVAERAAHSPRRRNPGRWLAFAVLAPLILLLPYTHQMRSVKSRSAQRNADELLRTMSRHGGAVAFVEDIPLLHPDLASVLHLLPNQVNDVEAALDSIHQDYLAIERDHLEFLEAPEGVVEVMIDPFPVQRFELEDRLWSMLQRPLGNRTEAFRSLKVSEDLLPFGDAGSQITIRRAPDGYRYTVVTGIGTTGSLQAHDDAQRHPPAFVRRLWRSRYPSTARIETTEEVFSSLKHRLGHFRSNRGLSIGLVWAVIFAGWLACLWIVYHGVRGLFRLVRPHRRHARHRRAHSPGRIL